MSISVSQFLPLHPLSPLGVHTFVPYGSVSISALQTRSFKITEIVSFERSEIIVILKKKKKPFHKMVVTPLKIFMWTLKVH